MARNTHEAALPAVDAGAAGHAPPIWRIDGGRAWFSSAALHGEVALDLPARGIAWASRLCEPCGVDAASHAADPAVALFADSPFHSLGVGGIAADDRQAVSPAEVYERGGDLVATYAETTARPLRVQVYWRVLPAEQLPGGASGIDLQVSAQTSLLDADSSLWTVARVPAGHVARLAGCAGNAECWLFRPATHEVSYAEMIHPADDRGCSLGRDDDAPDRWLLRRRLFGERLEKGVILRARLRGVLLPRRDDERLAAAACEAFLEEAPPLTT